MRDDLKIMSVEPELCSLWGWTERNGCAHHGHSPTPPGPTRLVRAWHLMLEFRNSGLNKLCTPSTNGSCSVSKVSELGVGAVQGSMNGRCECVESRSCDGVVSVSCEEVVSGSYERVLLESCEVVVSGSGERVVCGRCDEA